MREGKGCEMQDNSKHEREKMQGGIEERAERRERREERQEERQRKRLTTVLAQPASVSVKLSLSKKPLIHWPMRERRGERAREERRREGRGESQNNSQASSLLPSLLILRSPSTSFLSSLLSLPLYSSFVPVLASVQPANMCRGSYGVFVGTKSMGLSIGSTGSTVGTGSPRLRGM